MRTDQHRAHAAKEYGARDRRDLGLFHAVTQQHEGIGAHFVGSKVIRFVEIYPIDFVAGDEGVDLEGFVAIRNGGCNLVGFQDDVLAVFDLVAFDLIVPFDRIAGLAVDEFSLHPIAGFTV